MAKKRHLRISVGISSLVVVLLIVGLVATFRAHRVGADARTVHSYTLVDLDPNVNPNDQYGANGINDRGQIVGFAYFASGKGYAFLWQNGVMHDLGTLPGDRGSEATGINNLGQIVGASYGFTGGDEHAVLWQNGVIHTLSTLPGYSGSVAWGINSQGEIIGAAWPPSGYDRAVVWQNGVMRVLGTNISVAGINNLGQMVGVSYGSTGHNLQAVLWQNGMMRDLGTLPGDTQSIASGINDQGQIIGQSFTPGGTWHAFLWQNGVMRALATPRGYSCSGAAAINNLGQVVGVCTNPKGNGDFAVLWQKRKVQVLPGSLWNTPDAINDQGQIAGAAAAGGRGRHAVLWSPVSR